MTTSERVEFHEAMRTGRYGDACMLTGAVSMRPDGRFNFTDYDAMVEARIIAALRTSLSDSEQRLHLARHRQMRPPLPESSTPEPLPEH